jgi:hypothetical protein
MPNYSKGNANANLQFQRNSSKQRDTNNGEDSDDSGI